MVSSPLSKILVGLGAQQACGRLTFSSTVVVGREGGGWSESFGVSEATGGFVSEAGGKISTDKQALLCLPSFLTEVFFWSLTHTLLLLPQHTISFLRRKFGWPDSLRIIAPIGLDMVPN